MGFEDPCFDDTEDDYDPDLLASGHHFLEGITLERLERERSIRLNVAEPRPAVPAFCKRRVWNALGQVRTRPDRAGVRAAGGIAFGRARPAAPGIHWN